MLHQILMANGDLPGRVQICFQNTGREMPQTRDGCFLKSEANLGALAREYPARAKWWEDMETLAGELTSGSAAAWSKRYRREDLRDFMERQSDAFDLMDGQLCQADGGECFG